MMDTTDKSRMAGSSAAKAAYDRDGATYEIDLVELLFRLMENAKYIIIAALLGALAAGLYTQFCVTPTYVATSKLYVMNSSGAAINLSDLQIGNYLTSDYQEVFKNWHVHERVIQKLDLPYSYSKLSGMLDVTNPSDTRVLYITITSEDPDEAKLIADTYASVAQEFIATTMDTEEPNLFEEALRPTSPSAPSKTRNVMIGFILGAILACGVIVLIFVADDKVRSSDDVERYFGLPTLGMLPIQSGKTASSRKSRKEVSVSQ